MEANTINRLQPETVRDRDFYNWSIFIENEIENKPLWPEIMETLPRNCAFDPVLRQWTPIQCDSNGAVYVHEEPSPVLEANAGFLQCPVAGVLLRPANPKRVRLYIVNITTAWGGVYFVPPKVTALSFFMNYLMGVTLDGYLGEVYGYSASTLCNLSWLEMCLP